MDLKSITNNEEPVIMTETDNIEATEEEEVSQQVLPSELTDDENNDTETITNNKQSPFLDVSVTRYEGNESDSIMSELAVTQAKENQDEIDLIGIDLGLEDESNKEYNCHWQACAVNFNNSRQLTNHIFDSHVNQTQNFECKWNGCLASLLNKTTLITHIRRHSREKPYFCPSIECVELFTTPKDLLDHLNTVHDDQKANMVPWFNYLNELLDHSLMVEKDSLKDIKAARSRYNKIQTEVDFEESIKKPKIDFLKVQNIQVGDIVAEPSKKKGRTANSEINVEIRSNFKESNDAYKRLLVDSTKNIFQKLEGLEDLPRNLEIDSMNKTELMELYESLNRKLLWGLEVEQVLQKDFETAKITEERLWLNKEALLEASIHLEIHKDEQVYNLD